MFVFQKNYALIKDMNILIEDRNIELIKKIYRGFTSEYFVDASNEYFVKKNIHFQDYNVFEREVFMLQILKKYPQHFPTYISHTSDCIIMKYAGEKLTKDNKPDNIIEQVEEILSILESENIRHSDIKQGELLVSPEGNLILVDFGWTHMNGSLSFGSVVVDKIKPYLDRRTDREMIFNVVNNL
jgi:RIO-like serine/threonine protein kinase